MDLKKLINRGIELGLAEIEVYSSESINKSIKVENGKLDSLNTKAICGYSIRGKYNGKVSIPQAEMSMDYQMLIQQGKEEYDKAMESLEKRLERLRPVNMMKEQAELTESHNKIQQYTPLGMYVI